MSFLQLRNLQLPKHLVPDFPTRCVVQLILSCVYRRLISEFTTRTPGSFLEFVPERSAGDNYVLQYINSIKTYLYVQDIFELMAGVQFTSTN